MAKEELNEILKKLIGKTASELSRDDKLSLANTSSDSVVLGWLAGNNDWLIRKTVAKNPNTPIGTLWKLALDDDKAIRHKVARNPNTPVEILLKFASDDDWGDRLAVARNSNAPMEILRRLASDEDRDVRVAVAKNPKSHSSVAILFALLASGTIYKEKVETCLTKNG